MQYKSYHKNNHINNDNFDDETSSDSLYQLKLQCRRQSNIKKSQKMSTTKIMKKPTTKTITTTTTDSDLMIPIDLNIRLNVSFNIFVLADLHMEMNIERQQLNYYLRTIPSSTEVLILCGDIGDPRARYFSRFLRCCSDRFKIVLFVPGNHEHWFVSLRELESLCQSVNVQMLHNGTLTYKGITFAGTTLWTELLDINKKQIDDKSLNRINDLKFVKGLTRNKWTNKFQKATEFIKKTLNKHKKVIVITHHCPSFSLVQDYYRYSPLTACYASNCNDLLRHPSLIAWTFGHTHSTVRYLMKCSNHAILLNNSACTTDYLTNQSNTTNTNGWLSKAK